MAGVEKKSLLWLPGPSWPSRQSRAPIRVHTGWNESFHSVGVR